MSQPYDFPADAALARLSRKGIVASFINERLTLTHISQNWFGGDHPTYVLRGRA